MNRVIMVGNLGSDPKVKKLNEGLAVAKISLATTETYRLKKMVVCNQAPSGIQFSFGGV